MTAEYASAQISNCGRFRYVLRRRWGPGEPDAVFVMLNPSTADASHDDPTIRKCMGFARRWGNGGIAVVNLYAFRATDPADLKRAGWPIGPANDDAIHSYATAHGEAVLAWGGNARDGRAAVVTSMLRRAGVRLLCLGYTKAGQPRHPLMLPYSTPLQLFQGDDEQGGGA